MKIRITKQAGVNLTELVNKVCSALCKQFMMANGYDSVYYWPDEVYDDFVITRSRVDGKTYKIGYTVTDNGVDFAEPVEVEETYVEVSSQTASDQNGDEAHSISISPLVIRQALADSGAAVTGEKWRVQIIQFGMSLTRDIWQREIFAQSLSMWEGIPCYADHISESGMIDRPERSIREKVGWWSEFEVTDQGVDATLTLLPSAAWLAKDLLFCYQNNKPDFLGFSIFVRSLAKQVKGPDNQPATLHTKIIQPISTDCVTQAAANGRIKYALASARGREIPQGDETMNKAFLAMLFRDNKQRFELVRQSLAAANAQGINAQMSEDQLAEAICASEDLTKQCALLLNAVSAFQSTAPYPSSVPAQGNDPNAQTTAQAQTTTQAAPTNPRARQLEDMLIQQAWAVSGVPEAIRQARIAKLGANATLEDHQSAIEIAQEICGVYSQSGQVHNPATVTAESLDKRMIGLAKAFGLTMEDFNGIDGLVDRAVRQSGNKPFKAESDLWNSIPAVVSIRDFYVEMTGDVSLTGQAANGRGRITKQAVWLTTDFTEALSNVVNKRLIRDYRMEMYPIDMIATIKPARDFKTQRAILVGYFSDLPSVAQNAGYVSPSALTDTEELYAITKRGRLVELTLEDIANDDLGMFARMVGRLGRAAKRTLAKYVFNDLVMSNPTMNADGLAVFHASHNNLITDALGSTGLKNGVTKLLTQTEPGSNEVMSVDITRLQLYIHPTQALDAQQLTDFNNSPGGETSGLAQVLRRMNIKPHPINVFTDVNDWLLTASNQDIDMVELAFFNGNEEPEFFVQNNPEEGVSFSNDVVMRHKIRHIYGGVVPDHRGMVKSSVVG
ncbi:MAG: hypothetical protein AB1631_20620 [Acidobacteriota bacterium]